MVTSYKVDWKGPKQSSELRYFVAQLEVCPSTQKKHWQGYLEVTKKMRFSMVKKLLEEPTAHLEPRWGTQAQAIEYCTKMDTRAEPYQKIEIGQPAAVGRPPSVVGKNNEERNQHWRNALDPCLDVKEAVNVIIQASPRDYLVYGQQIRTNLENVKKQKVPWSPRFIEYPWMEPEALTRWKEEEFVKKERARCLILVGPTKLGKTEWARHLCPENHTYWRGMTNMMEWRDDARLLIFDDIDWEYIPQKKSLLTQMGQAVVTDKYMKKLTVNVRMPAIVLTNNIPDWKNDADYWAENAKVIQLTDKLYDPNLQWPPVVPLVGSQDLADPVTNSPPVTTDDATTEPLVGSQDLSDPVTNSQALTIRYHLFEESED